MSSNSLNCERKKLAKLRKFQLPNSFKKVGIGFLIFSFIALFVNKFTLDNDLFRLVLKYGMLVGLLLISISKEKIEDEMILKLRMQSYTFAFISGVVYSLALPFIDYAVDFALKGEGVLKDAGDFEILWMLLTFQVLYFEFLKRGR